MQDIRHLFIKKQGMPHIPVFFRSALFAFTCSHERLSLAIRRSEGMPVCLTGKGEEERLEFHWQPENRYQSEPWKRTDKLFPNSKAPSFSLFCFIRSFVVLLVHQVCRWHVLHNS